MMTIAYYVFFGLSILCVEVVCVNNGSAADYLPYQVCIQRTNNVHCGGAILDKYHILTAAHCIKGFKIEDLSVVTGLTIYSGARYPVLNVHIHENYQPHNGWPNDIAVLRLVTPIVFGKDATPAILPQRGQFWPTGQSAVVSGFGFTDGKHKTSEKLLRTQVFIENNIACQEAYPTDEIRSTNICARHPSKATGSCRGDSGSPLTVNGVVIGVTSHSHLDRDDSCGEPMEPQVYTRVSEYVEWINRCRQT